MTEQYIEVCPDCGHLKWRTTQCGYCRLFDTRKETP